MTESKFTDSLRKKLVPHVYALKLNLRFMKGVPDCYYSGSKTDLWNEHKYLKRIPKRIDLCNIKATVSLSIHQQKWLTERHAEGRNVAVIVGSEEGHIFLPGLTWEEPISKESFLEKAMKTSELARFIIQELGERSHAAPAMI